MFNTASPSSSGDFFVSTSTLHASGDLIPAAEENLLAHGSRLQAGGKLVDLASGGDMTLTASR